jgi:HEAT repeat protein
MDRRQDVSFDAVLAGLFAADEPSIPLLYRLSDLKSEEFSKFKTAWSEAKEERRSALARHMADIAEDNYLVDFSPVFAYFLTDGSPNVRIAALDGVWDSDDTKMIAPISELMAVDNDVDVRASAARALAHYILLAEWGQIESVHTEPIVAALLAELEKPAVPVEVRRAALEAVAVADDPRIAQHILDAYEDGAEDLQLSAIFAMGNTADSFWLPTLEQELASPSADFRAEAARACGMLGDEQAIEGLEQLLNDEDSDVISAAIYALGQIGGDRASDILSHLAEDTDFDEFQDVIDEALEEMEWTGGEFDMLSFPENEDFPSDDLRLN